MSEVYFGPSDHADDDTPYEDSANMPVPESTGEFRSTLPDDPTRQLAFVLSPDEDVPRETILMSLHNYLEDTVGLTSVEASTVLYGMIDTGTIPSPQELEDDPADTLAKLKVGLYTDIIPLYATLHDIKQFREWLPGMMEVVFEGHPSEHYCLEDRDHDKTHCAKGYCPVKVVCLDVKQQLRRPHHKSLEYQHLPVDTAQMWVAKLDYLVEEDYLTEYENGRLYDQYSRRLAKGLKGFDLNKSDNWF